jgi:hypothetical protein
VAQIMQGPFRHIRQARIERDFGADHPAKPSALSPQPKT